MFVKQSTQLCMPIRPVRTLTAPSNIILIVALRHHQCLPPKISDRGMGCNTWNTFDHAGTMVHNPATSPSSRLRAGQHIAISPSSPGHHIGSTDILSAPPSTQFHRAHRHVVNDWLRRSLLLHTFTPPHSSPHHPSPHRHIAQQSWPPHRH